MDQYKNLDKKDLLAKLEEFHATSDTAKLVAERDAAQARVKELERSDTSTENKELQRQVKDLKGKLEATEATKGDDRPVVTVNGEQLMVVARKVNIRGEIISAKELASRSDLLKELVKEKSAVLRPVKHIVAEKEAAKRKEDQRAKASIQEPVQPAR